MITRPTFHLFDDICHELNVDDALHAFCDMVVTNHGALWWVADGLIMRGNHIFIPASSPSLPMVL